MLRALNDVPRFESFDFVSKELTIPMRIGERIAGWMKISGGKNALIIHLGAQQALRLQIKRFLRYEASCLQCPKCRKWRKRLFLRETIPSNRDDIEYKLLCTDCWTTCRGE